MLQGSLYQSRKHLWLLNLALCSRGHAAAKPPKWLPRGGAYRKKTMEAPQGIGWLWAISGTGEDWHPLQGSHHPWPSSLHANPLQHLAGSQPAVAQAQEGRGVPRSGARNQSWTSLTSQLNQIWSDSKRVAVLVFCRKKRMKRSLVTPDQVWFWLKFSGTGAHLLGCVQQVCVFSVSALLPRHDTFALHPF